MTFAKRFIDAENLPSEFDVRQAFCSSHDDIAEICERFRHGRGAAAAIQLLFLRASGRPMDRFALVPKTLLRPVCRALQTSAVSIASLRALYACRQTLYEPWVSLRIALTVFAAMCANRRTHHRRRAIFG
jgi:hypothetical protein